MPSSVPPHRIRTLNRHPESSRGAFVLYWMIAARRTRYNFALQHAADRADTLGLPLVILEPLRVDYRWASDRFHRFIIDGMVDNAAALEDKPAHYHPYLESVPGASKGMLVAFSKRAALVVTDDAPIFFLPRMVEAAASKLSVCLQAVDSNGLYPLRATDRVFERAVSFRRHLQAELPEHLADFPRQRPLVGRSFEPLQALPSAITKRWPASDLSGAQEETWIRSLPIDHRVPGGHVRGGRVAARRALQTFLRLHLEDYPELRNQPEADCQSHLSPYLHFGHISAHEVFLAVTATDDWSPERLAERVTGSRRGWWGASEAVEAFLDQLITWRELGFNAAVHDPQYKRYESLPAWARNTLQAHAGDPRPVLYTEEELESATTHDALWNAAQTQLLTEGSIHNYLRMLWGKKILEWSPSPQVALQTLIELNNKYAIDGRDPNSYSGIFWILGRYDRAWGPERDIFGKIRYMSSDNTARKLDLRGYLSRYGAG